MKKFCWNFGAGILGGAFASLVFWFFFAGRELHGNIPQAQSRGSAPTAVSRPLPVSLPEASVLQKFVQAAAIVEVQKELKPIEQPDSPWMKQINTLIDTLPPEQAVARMAALMSSLPPEDQAEVAWRIDSMVFDEDYQIVANLLRAPGTNPAVWGILHDGLQRRPDNIRLPLLAVLASNHPLGEAAQQELRTLFGWQTNYFPPSWQVAVTELLETTDNMGQ